MIYQVNIEIITEDVEHKYLTNTTKEISKAELIRAYKLGDKANNTGDLCEPTFKKNGYVFIHAKQLLMIYDTTRTETILPILEDRDRRDFVGYLTEFKKYKLDKFINKL